MGGGAEEFLCCNLRCRGGPGNRPRAPAGRALLVRRCNSLDDASRSTKVPQESTPDTRIMRHSTVFGVVNDLTAPVTKVTGRMEAVGH